MKLWRIQRALAEDIGCPSVHRSEDTAADEVLNIFKGTILPRLRETIRLSEQKDDVPELTAEAKAAEAEITALIDAGDLWTAYDRWQDFAARYEEILGSPAWHNIGTVIVETREWPGPTRRVPLIKTGIWRVQIAHGTEVSEPMVFRSEEVAKTMVEAIIIQILLPQLRNSVAFNENLGQYLGWVADGKATESAIMAVLQVGDVWAAYNLWHQLEDKHANTWTYPIWVKIGTVIVETREAGPSRQIPVMRPERMPISRFDPGEGAIAANQEFFSDPNVADAFRKLKDIPGEGTPPAGPSMGAVFRRWKISFADFGGQWHPSVHTSDEPLLAELVGWLHVLIRNISSNIQIFVLRGEHPEFTRDAMETMDRMSRGIEGGDPWESYHAFKEFEERWPFGAREGQGPAAFPLWMQIGTVVVEGPGSEGATLGAQEVARWILHYADSGGRWHPSVHTSENLLWEEMDKRLERILSNIRHISFVFEPGGCFPKYTSDAKRTTESIEKKIAAGDGHAAYETFKKFESRWQTLPGTFGKYPFWFMVGTVEVEGPGLETELQEIPPRRHEER